jgi:dTDP-4-dehydrorhamnose 3,5-epimerase
MRSFKIKDSLLLVKYFQIKKIVLEPMNFKELDFEGAYLIEHLSHKDHRGYFATSYCRKEFSLAGIPFIPDQSSFSFSEHVNTLRGMHFQKGIHAQGKLVKCVKGKVLDVIIDLRQDSKSFGQHIKFVLSEDNNKMLWVPKGFAHGFLTLEPNCLVFYQFSNFYYKPSEGGVRWNDPFFNIDWPVSDPILSDRDANHPYFES